MKTQIRVTTHKSGGAVKAVLHVFLGQNKGYSVRANFPARINRQDAIADGLARAREMAAEAGKQFNKTHRNAGVIA